MKTAKALLKITMTCLLCILCMRPHAAYAEGKFIDNPAEIDKAADSVLMLEVYDKKGSVFKTGSGFIAFDDGILITNYHVIDEGSYVIAYTDNGNQYRISQVLCANEAMDIAILSFEEMTNLSPLQLSVDNNLLRGQAVVAIGSPIGITNTVSIGNISALYTDNGIPWIQFTAPISHGSSGGVLFDENGLVLGITSATWDEGQNLNLAIRSTVAAAMYGSWDGNVFDLNKAPKNSPVNFSMIDSASALVVGITPLPETTEWICADCGNKNNTLFCVNCGKARPEWICVCGQTNISMFCGHCGQSVRSLVDIFNEACQDLQAERFEQALRSFSSLERFDSKTYETTAGKNANASEFARHCHYLLGGYLLGQNRFDDAISQYRLAGTTWLDTAVCIQRAYYLQGTALLDEERYTEAIEVFSRCNRFSDAEERIQYAYYQLGVQQYNAGQYETAAENFINAGAYSDAPQWLLKIDYTKAVAEGEKGLYKNAVKMLEKIADYPPATDKIKEYSFLIGEDAFERKEYAQAISFFIKADDYANASDLLKTTYDVFIRHHCRYGSYVTAYALWQEAAGYQIIFEDTVLFSPGINDDLVTGLLTLAKDMGFISSLPQKETVYAEKYTAAIIKMKAYFGLREDEFVRLSEMAYLSQIVYPNLSGRKVVPLLEKVKDLKYWTGSLPEDHSSYLLKYVEAVKSAETNLGLKADGFLTLEEQTVLLNQVTPTPKSVKKLTAKEINGGVKLSWGIADGAVAYDLYRNKTKIATVNGTSYTDDGFWVKSGYYTYHIIPHSYSMSARATYSERVYLGRR